MLEWLQRVVSWTHGCRVIWRGLPLITALLAVSTATAAPVLSSSLIRVAGIPIDFVLFGLTLVGVVVFHNQSLKIAVAGSVTIALYKILFTGFSVGTGVGGFGLHMAHEWVVLTNLLCLLTGFALLSRHFEKSQAPAVMQKYLTSDWQGAFVLLVMVFGLSAFLDNIAGALVGGAMAHQLFRARVHIGYLAAIVAASNAGGSGSVVGDTTTTMLWISGVSPVDVVEAYIGAGAALFIFGIPAALQQHKYSPILKNTGPHARLDWGHIAIVGLILLFAVVTNVVVNLTFNTMADRFPFIGVAVWVAILISLPWRRPDWEVLPTALKGAFFLLSLVTCASMMPVEELPKATWGGTLGLGFFSAVFDNIPLTAIAIKQGGYDWGFLAYAVGCGGSMIWFGSSAGVALMSMYPEGKSVWLWLKHGWHVAVAYVVGFFVLLAVLGWHPDTPPNTIVTPLPQATAE